LPRRSNELAQTKADVVTRFAEALFETRSRLKRPAFDLVLQDRLLPRAMLVHRVRVFIGKDGYPRVACPRADPIGKLHTQRRAHNEETASVSAARVSIEPDRGRRFGVQ
jgi:hypothetical protein